MPVRSPRTWDDATHITRPIEQVEAQLGSRGVANGLLSVCDILSRCLQTNQWRRYHQPAAAVAISLAKLAVVACRLTVNVVSSLLLVDHHANLDSWFADPEQLLRPPVQPAHSVRFTQLHPITCLTP